MSTQSFQTILIATAMICLAAVLAVATTHRERAAGPGAGYSLLMEDAVRSR